MTDPTNLVAFLLARIAERETDAYRALDHAEGELWVVTGMDSAVGVDYDPQLVLAECAALRQIAAYHRPRGVQGGPPYRWTCMFCDDAPVPWEAYGSWPCQHLRLLASAWADRPGYDPSWAVES